MDRTVLVRLKADPSNFVRGVTTAKTALRSLTSEIDKTNDRTAWLAQGMLAIGPALAPLGAVAVPVITGLATQMGLAASAAGVAALAFNGVGDSLGALNDYQLEPTAANMEKVRQEFERIGPAGTEFVMFLDSIGGDLSTLQDAAREGMFPGMQEGIEALLTRLPQVRTIVREIAEGMGQLTAEGGAGLAGGGFDDFFTYLEHEAQPLLIDMGRTLGNFVEGLAQMVVAFGPLTERFSGGFLQMSRDFAVWADGLEGNRTFQDFVNYINRSIPAVEDLIRSVAEAFVALAQAAAPVGDVMLPALSAFFDVVGALVSTPLGTLFIGLAAATSLYGRAAALASITTGGLFKNMTPVAGAVTAQTRATLTAIPTLNQFGTALAFAGQAAENQNTKTRAAMTSVGQFARGLAPAAASVAAMGVIMSDLDDNLGLANTAMLGMAGTMVGGPWGAAIGATIGAFMDASAASDGFTSALERAHSLMQQTPAELQQQATAIAQVRTEYEAFRTSITDEDLIASTIKGFQPAAMKNTIEDIFGDSDIEEQRESLVRLEDELRRNKLAWAALGDAMAGWDGPATRIDDLDRLEQIARSAAPAMEDLGYTLDELAAMKPMELGEAAAEIQAYITAADSTRGRSEGVAESIAALDDEMLSTADSASALTTALEALLGPGLSAEEATDAWRASLAGLREEMEGTRRTFQGYSADALLNREVTRGYAEDVVGMLTAQAEAGASTQKIARGLQEARAAFIAEGIAADFSREQMEARADAIGLTPRLIRTIFETPGLSQANGAIRTLRTQYDLTPKQVRTAIEQINMGKSRADIRDLLQQYGLTPKQIRTAVELLGVAAAEAALNNVARDRTVNIFTRQLGVQGVPRSLRPPREFATGGYTGPGAKYEPAGVVHRGEFVHDAETTARIRPLLEAIHQTKGMLAGYAAGGYVANPYVRPVAAVAAAPAVAGGFTEDQFRRLEAAAERGTARGAARGGNANARIGQIESQT